MSFWGGGSSSGSSSDIPPPPPSSSSSGSTNTKNILIQNIRAAGGLGAAQNLIELINSNCFEKCVPNPGTKLDNTEQTCLSRCMERYMATWNIVSRAYVSRVTKESSSSDITQGGVSY